MLLGRSIAGRKETGCVTGLSDTSVFAVAKGLCGPLSDCRVLKFVTHARKTRLIPPFPLRRDMSYSVVHPIVTKSTTLLLCHLWSTMLAI